MFPLVQNKIWAVLGKYNDMIPYILDAFLQSSTEAGLGTKEAEALSNTVVTLATVNEKLVPSHIIHRTVSTLIDKNDPVEYMILKKSWPEIAMLLRFILMMSFNNLIDVKEHLPDLCFIIVVLVSHGRPWIRSTVHGITINMLHSISIFDDIDDASLDILNLVLRELSEPTIATLFGLSGSGMVHQHHGTSLSEGWAANTSHSAFVFSNDSLTGERESIIQPQSLKTIIYKILEVVSTGAGSKGDILFLFDCAK